MKADQQKSLEVPSSKPREARTRQAPSPEPGSRRTEARDQQKVVELRERESRSHLFIAMLFPASYLTSQAQLLMDVGVIWETITSVGNSLMICEVLNFRCFSGRVLDSTFEPKRIHEDP